jgi:hypothetical protein
MSQNDYNGWTNRETWLVNVWFEPESRSDVQYAREVLEEQYNQLPDGVLKDMVDLSAVNWDELEDHSVEESEPDCDDSDDGYALASAGFGTDEDYGYAGDDY